MKAKRSNQKKRTLESDVSKKPLPKRSRKLNSNIKTETTSQLQRITTTPGLQHIAEDVFANLSHKTLMKCRKINKNWESLVENPWVLYKACIQKGLFSSEQEQKWNKIIQKLNHSILSEQLPEVLTQIHSGKVTDERERIIFHGKKCPFLKKYVEAINEGNSKIVEILAPLMTNPNAAGLFSYNRVKEDSRKTPIHIAARGMDKPRFIIQLLVQEVT